MPLSGLPPNMRCQQWDQSNIYVRKKPLQLLQIIDHNNVYLVGKGCREELNHTRLNTLSGCCARRTLADGRMCTREGDRDNGLCFWTSQRKDDGGDPYGFLCQERCYPANRARSQDDDLEVQSQPFAVGRTRSLRRPIKTQNMGQLRPKTWMRVHWPMGLVWGAGGFAMKVRHATPRNNVLA